MSGTIRISTDAKIGVPGQADSSGTTFIGALDAGHLTVEGKTTSLTRSLPIAAGHINIAGKNVALVVDTFQTITITSLASIGVPGTSTLYDALDPGYGLTPAIGDVFRTPRFSTDGGTINLAVDGRFEVGSPTSGFDSIPNVLYTSIVTGLTYGPVTLTILNPTLVMTIQRGHMIWDGKDLPMNRTRFITRGHLVTFGHLLKVNRLYALVAGHLTLSGAGLSKNRSLLIEPGHLTFEGKTVNLDARLNMVIEAGHLTVEGKDVTVTRSLPIEAGHLTVTGRDITLALGVPYFVNPPGHLSITGATVRIGRVYVIQPGHLTVHGKSVSAVSTGAVAAIDKPGVRTFTRRRNMISSQVD